MMTKHRKELEEAVRTDPFSFYKVVKTHKEIKTVIYGASKSRSTGEWICNRFNPRPGTQAIVKEVLEEFFIKCLS